MLKTRVALAFLHNFHAVFSKQRMRKKIDERHALWICVSKKSVQSRTAIWSLTSATEHPVEAVRYEICECGPMYFGWQACPSTHVEILVWVYLRCC